MGARGVDKIFQSIRLRGKARCGNRRKYDESLHTD
jgi:hypothetical protein